MAVYAKIFQRNVSRRIRVQAFLNLVCAVYMVVLTSLATHIGFFHMVPTCFYEQWSLVITHRVIIWYLFTCVLGSFFTCIFTDPGAHGEPISTVSKTRKEEIAIRTRLETAAKDHNADCIVMTKGPTSTTNVQSKLDKTFNVIKTAQKETGAQKETSVTKETGVKKETGVQNEATGDDNADSTVKDSNAEVDKPTEEIIGLYCVVCKLMVPIRTHHCYLCQKCVLQRDHHCFFMGVCVGKPNQKYFIFFTFFMAIGTMYAMIMAAKYLNFLYGTQFHGPQTFLTLLFKTILSFVQGNLPTLRFLVIFIVLYASLSGTLFTFGLFFWQMCLVTSGQTTYESKCGETRYSQGSMVRNLRETFDGNWLVSLLVPFWDLATDRHLPKIKSQ